MSQGNEYEGEGLHPQSLTETIDPEIVEDAQTIESEQEGLSSQSLIDTIDATIVKDAQKIESLFSSFNICRVPKELRKLKESAYTPRLIAIGPLHRNDEHLQTPMQSVKGSYTNYLLSRLSEGETNHNSTKQKRSNKLKECVAAMMQSIDDAKKCYAEEVTVDEEMLLVDGCFIIELLYRAYLKQEDGGASGNTQALSRAELPPEVQEITESNSKEKTADPIFYNDLNHKDIRTDLLLLENQIPFFVLQKLFDLTINKIPNHSQLTLNKLSSEYFCDMIWINSKEKSLSNDIAMTTNCGSASDCVITVKEEVLSRYDKYKHILDKVHRDYLPRHQTNNPSPSTEHKTMPVASDLDYAGVKFVPCSRKDPFTFKKPEGPFWWFRRASFKIPPLDINDDTEVVLRNFIAFEQCFPDVLPHFTSYARLMDMLVDSEKDVDKLKKVKVMHNYLGSNKDATDLFNELCKEIIRRDPFFFADQCNDAADYSDLFWPRNMAHLRRTYFASPCTFIAFCVGFIVSGMSIIGSIFAVLEKRQ